ncbi:MAG: tetratricopeptide repeat protein, partial [Isosphaeraceae bacterium]
DEKLAALFHRAHRTQSRIALKNAALALIQRPEAIERLGLLSLTIYTDLATLASRAGNHQEALDWIRRGRQADPQRLRAVTTPQWDMVELRLRSLSEEPEDWVPELAAIMDRYQENAGATQLLLANLVDMGLIEVSPKPDKPDEMLFDTRPLQALLSRYGPKVTTASGRLGVSATNPEIWTPAASTGGSTGIWTPGGANDRGTEGGERKLIVPGR